MSEFLKTNEVATALGIGREAARLLMKRTRGVIVLPTVKWHRAAANETDAARCT